MVEYFYKGLIFAPVYACVVYAVIFLINWKRLHVSQRIFTFSLFAILCSLLLAQCIIMEDLEVCKPLVFLNSFAGPALVVLFFLFTYSQMQTKSIFRPRLLALYSVPFISTLLLSVDFITGEAGNKELEAIVYSVVHSTSDLQTTTLITFQYLLYRAILIFGSIAVAIYYIYKIRWYEKLAQKYIADSDSAVMPMSKQLTFTFILFVAVTLAQFFKKIVPEDYYIVGAEIYGVILVGLIIHTCRAVHHGYTRMPIEGEEAEQLDVEMQFLYDSFDEKTWSLAGIGKEETVQSQEALQSQEPVQSQGAQGTAQEAQEAQEAQKAQGSERVMEDPEAPESPKRPATPDNPERQERPESPASLASPDNPDNPESPATQASSDNPETDKKDVISYVQASEIEHELKKVMMVKRLYMQQNITIKDVANAIGTNHYYLSVYMNRVLKTSFSDYINRLRIEREVLPRMEKNPQISTKELIIAGNFSHRTTFYRAFQKVMGITFQEYKAKMNA